MPLALGLPIGKRGVQHPFKILLGKTRVKRQLHLVNGDSFGIEVDCFLHCFTPGFPCLAYHSSD